MGLDTSNGGQGGGYPESVPSGSDERRDCSPPGSFQRLCVVLLPRSVDVVEERHGERHAQELPETREEENEETVNTGQQNKPPLQ